MSLVDVEELKDIAEVEYHGIVESAEVTGPNELRIFLKEGSFIDVWFSLKLEGRYSYHWERRQVGGGIYRHDNAPHQDWEHLETFPRHFHAGSETKDDCIDSTISDEPKEAIREFLDFVKEKVEPD